MKNKTRKYGGRSKSEPSPRRKSSQKHSSRSKHKSEPSPRKKRKSKKGEPISVYRRVYNSQTEKWRQQPLPNKKKGILDCEQNRIDEEKRNCIQGMINFDCLPLDKTTVPSPISPETKACYHKSTLCNHINQNDNPADPISRKLFSEKTPKGAEARKWIKKHCKKEKEPIERLSRERLSRERLSREYEDALEEIFIKVYGVDVLDIINDDTAEIYVEGADGVTSTIQQLRNPVLINNETFTTEDMASLAEIILLIVSEQFGGQLSRQHISLAKLLLYQAFLEFLYGNGIGGWPWRQVPDGQPPLSDIELHELANGLELIKQISAIDQFIPDRLTRRADRKFRS